MVACIIACGRQLLQIIYYEDDNVATMYMLCMSLWSCAPVYAACMYSSSQLAHNYSVFGINKFNFNLLMLPKLS